MIVARAVAENSPVDTRLSHGVLKTLLGLKFSIRDVASVDKQTMASLESIKDGSGLGGSICSPTAAARTLASSRSTTAARRSRSPPRTAAITSA
jgi:hypothetical protein